MTHLKLNESDTLYCVERCVQLNLSFEGEVRIFIDPFAPVICDLYNQYVKKRLMYGAKGLIHIFKRYFTVTVAYFREVLCSSEVTEFVNTRMLFWACCTNRPEGYRGVISFWLYAHRLSVV